MLNVLYTNLLDVENKNTSLNEQVKQVLHAFKELQDQNLDLEVEHLNSLQDLAILDTQLTKYQYEYRTFEVSLFLNNI